MKKCYLLVFLTLFFGRAIAQPAGWSAFQAFTVTNNSSSAVYGYQMPIIVNTQTLISSNAMLANGNDVRFGPVCNLPTFYPYYLDSGLNTANTRFFVKIDTLLPSASKTVYMFYGNASAAAASTLSIFNGPYSATNQVTGGTSGGVLGYGNQRGFRFAPNSDILVTQFGKNEPSGTTRYVTLFDFNSQAQLLQLQVSGAGGSYYYNNLTQPKWLTAGTQYVIQLFQTATDGYYYQTSSQINPNLTYYDMRYCNSCTQTTFPTTVLTNYHYGYPDFNFYTRNSVTPAPTLTTGGTGGVGFTTQPASIFPCVGTNASIAAVVAGTASSMQWQMLVGSTWTNLTNTPPYSGVNTATLSISNVTAAMNGNQYRLQVTSTCGTGNSIAASITVTPPPTPTVSYSSPLSFCEGSAVVLNTYQAAGLTYQWVKDSVLIPGAIGTNFIASQSGNYSVQLTNGAGCTGTSATVRVNVLPLPMPTITRVNRTMSTGLYSSYQWYLNTQPIAGATGQSYTAIVDGPYAVAVTDSAGCRNLSSVTYISTPVTGVSTTSGTNDIKIYPNPANSYVTIENYGRSQLTAVAILNGVGAKLYEAPVKGNILTIPLSQLPTGIYTLRIEDSQGFLTRKLEIIR